MQYPSIAQYKQAVQNCAHLIFWYDNYISFTSLKNKISYFVDNYREPMIALGSNSVIFHITDKNNFNSYALKCFTSEIKGRAKRQKQIVEFIRQNPSDYIIDYQYLENELFVKEGEGRQIPVALLEWVEAPSLGEMIEQYCMKNDLEGLNKLAQSFQEFAIWLLKQPFAHGDLSHDNLLVCGDGCIVMVDYDGMYIPAFDGIEAIELGNKNYQHPKRTINNFNAYLDDFSILVIYLSLLALAEAPELYKKYNNGQNIIFESTDFIIGEKSSLIQDLLGHKNLSDKVEELLRICRFNIGPIVDLYKLLDPPLSKEDFISELKITNQQIINKLERLQRINLIQMDRSFLIEEALDTQIANTKILLDNLLDKMNTSNDYNEINEKLWNSFSNQLQGLLYLNCELENDIERRCNIDNKGHRNIRLHYPQIINFDDIDDKLKNIKELIFTYFEISLDFLKYFNSIEKLYLDGVFLDLDAINYLENLKYLELVSVKFSNEIITRRKKLDFYNLISLKHLVIKNSSIGLNSFSNSKSIEEMELGTPNELSLIQDFPLLNSLILTNNNSDLKPLAGSKSLLKINLTNNLSSLSSLSEIKNLNSLSVSYDEKFEGNFEFFLRPKMITTHRTYYDDYGHTIDSDEEIEFYDDSKVRNYGLDDNNYRLNFLSKLVKIKTLELHGFWIDLDPIKALTNLTHLVLDLPWVDDFSPLSFLKNLKVLNIRNKNIDLSVLKNLTELEELIIKDCNINDFSPLLSLNKLRILEYEDGYHKKIQIFESISIQGFISADENREKRSECFEDDNLPF